MHIERRCATRYNFGAIAEVIDLGQPNQVVSLTRDLSLYGCFVKTPMPFAKGTEVRVRIRHSGADFTAVGNVTDNVTREGMGIKFVQIRTQDQGVLEEWLDVIKAPGDVSASEPAPSVRLTRNIPVTVSGQSTAGEFSEDTETQVITTDGALLHLLAQVSRGQVIRLKNRLTRMEQSCRVLYVDSTLKDKPKLLAIEFLEPAQNFWRIETES
jgi:PilZ domain